MSKLNLLVLAKPGNPSHRLLEALPGSPQIDITVSEEEALRLAPEADVILTGVGASAPLISAVVEKILSQAQPRLQWLHSLSAGVDHLMATGLRQSAIPVTNAKGAYSGSLGEYCVAAMLFFAKNVRRLVNSQRDKVWDVFDVDMLEGKTLGIIGYGDIGKAAARRAKPFGVKVIAMRRRPERSANDSDADEIWGLDRKMELIAASDYILLAMPNAPDTVGFIAEAELAAMKPSAVLINLGRGTAISEKALIPVLAEGRIRGAALDVFEQEPLADGHVFYGMENLLLSAHCADHTPTWQDDSMQIFVRNFAHFSAGEALENLVDKTVGY
jgi:phosphoglycerate dehydrogenase-like enzyme